MRSNSEGEQNVLYSSLESVVDKNEQCWLQQLQDVEARLRKNVTIFVLTASEIGVS